jgi:hypothetical protein
LLFADDEVADQKSCRCAAVAAFSDEERAATRGNR